MIDLILMFLARCLIGLRYRVRIRGLEAVLKKGRTGILFLPNHPALIDPVILMSWLYPRFKVRALADEKQVDRFLIRRVARRIRVLSMPALSEAGIQSAREVRQVMDRCIEALRHEDNLLLYPAGRIYRQGTELIGANSAVDRILRAVPDVRVVLVSTRGLWGSGFGWAAGSPPQVQSTLWKGLKAILLNGLFFTPRRGVEIELVEPLDLPRHAGRRESNAYLEAFYNRTAEPNTYVPYTIWERGGIRIRPEPDQTSHRNASREVSPTIRRQVFRHLQEVTGVTGMDDGLSLARDLGMDSLAIVELITWLGTEYGHAHIEVDSLRTVEDVLLAASGEAASTGERRLQIVPARWFRDRVRPRRPEGLKDMTLTAAFLHQARLRPGRPIVSDPISGVKTYRDMIRAILILRRQFGELPGMYLGLMLPATVAVSIVYLAALFAGKVPVMVNWTLGRKNLLHALDALDVGHILTSRALISRIRAQGMEIDAVTDRFVYMEDLRGRIGRRDKIRALIQSYGSWSSLSAAHPPDTAVVLFTSGSENVPKAVPLTHRNILTNVADAYECFTIGENDGFLGILPPFHSFGLTVSMALPLTLGVPVVYYPNPTHGGVLGEIIEAYRLTILVGTPTFLNGIIRTSRPEQLVSLRLVVSGAEKCPRRVYDLLKEVCPRTTVLEGYGVTECSPVISVNHEDDPRAGTIGRVLSSIEYVIVDPACGERVPVGREGMLLVRGDSVFGGYLQYDGQSPFVEFEGRSWYRTGDLVVADETGLLTFQGRLKRFIKLGGEMISLPAIESVLEQRFADPSDDGPVRAVVATPVEENPDIVLFSTRPIARESANAALRQAGLSGLHNIRQVVSIDCLPLLGTGKIDHKALAGLLAGRCRLDPDQE